MISPRRPSRRLLPSFAALVLALLVLAVFLPAGDNGFIEYHDDTSYVTGNERVRSGLTLGGLTWALRSTEALNWHPLTWLSHMLDVELFGLDPRGHHLVNVAWHLANTLLLFFVVRAMTGAVWSSAFAAALFGVHPLHVESVAWVAERKDVLSAFFWLLAMGAYLRYARAPSAARYGAVLAAAALGFTCKAMLVTLPAALLLLDAWPLGRIGKAARARAGGAPRRAAAGGFSQALAEKVPLALLAAAVGLLTFVAQLRGGVVRSLETFPLSVRLGNAVVSYASYLGKTIWPRDLAFLYPHRQEGLPWWQILGACALLLAVSVLAVRAGRTRPSFGVGWFWYLVTLLPVIGLVQLGSQAMADRYTDLPLIGPFIAIAWAAGDWAGGDARRRTALAAAGGLTLAFLMPLARTQVSFWKDSETLFTHSLEAGGEDWLLRNSLGLVQAGQGRLEEALAQYSRAIALSPEALFPHVNRGAALGRLGRMREARDCFVEALRLRPDSPEVLANLGLAEERLGDDVQAARRYREVLRLRPGDGKARRGLERLASSPQYPPQGDSGTLSPPFQAEKNDSAR